MRHMNAGRKLSRNSSHREAMFRNMVTSLMVHGRIQTTVQKAKELRRYAEKVITLGRKYPASALTNLTGEELQKAKAKRVHAIRQAKHWVRDDAALNRVFTEYAERYATRPGGYTRILKLGFRPGDDAAMAIIELVNDASGSENAASTGATEEAAGSGEGAAAETPAAEEAPKKRTRKKKSEEAAE